MNKYTCSLNGVYHPHWLVQWSHCSHIRIPVHSSWLPGYIDVVQTILITLTMVGLFLDRPCISKQTRGTNLKNICTHMFIAALFTIAKIWKQPKCPSVDEWIKMLWYIYTMEYFAYIKKKEILPFMTSWVYLESIMLSEISQ